MLWSAILLVYILYSLPIYLIAWKSGESNAWFAWVPFLDFWLMCEMADVDPNASFLAAIPVLDLFFYIYLWMRISENTNKSPLWGILMIVPIVNLLVGYYLALYEPDSIR